MARLRPWLEREMLALLPRGQRGLIAAGALLLALQTYSMEHSHFINAAGQLLNDNVNHFLHELRLFSASYYDMHGWDVSAQYTVPSIPILNSDLDIIPDEDNDLQIVEIVNLPNTPILTEIITISDSEDVQVVCYSRPYLNWFIKDFFQIEIESDHPVIEISNPPNRQQSTGSSSLLSIVTLSEPTQGSTSRNKSPRRKAKKRRAREEPPQINLDSQTEDSDEDLRHLRARIKRTKAKRSSKRIAQRRFRHDSYSGSSDSDSGQVRKRQSRPKKYRSLRSVVVVPSKNS